MKGMLQILSCGLLILAGSIGCSAGSSQVAKEFGNSTRELTERQVAHPERSERRTPVLGMGATTAGDVTTNYHRNQQTDVQERRQERQRDNGLSDID